ncbi:MAG: hypothetical protein ACWGQW_15630, partial [bacterium]
NYRRQIDGGGDPSCGDPEDHQLKMPAFGPAVWNQFGYQRQKETAFLYYPFYFQPDTGGIWILRYSIEDSAEDQSIQAVLETC